MVEFDHPGGAVTYIDTVFGNKGRFWWVCIIGSLVVLYQLSTVVKMLGVKLYPPVDWMFIGVLFIAFVLLVLLLLGALLAVYQGVVTMQRVVASSDNLSCTGWFYSGRRLDFNRNEVCAIFPARSRIFKSFNIPLGRGGDNFKVQLENGQSFYISGAMPNADMYIRWLKEK